MLRGAARALAVLGVAAAAAGAWWLVREGAAPTADPAGSTGADDRTAKEAGLDPGRATGTPEAPPRGTGTIRGLIRRGASPARAQVEVRRVLDASPPQRLGTNLPALVAVSPLSPRPLAEAAAGEDGRFVVAGLPAGVHQVRASAPDGARGSALVRLRAEGASVEVEIALLAGTETLRGRAVFTDGRPWTGEVWVRRLDAGGAAGDLGLDLPWGDPVPTDGAGAFTASGLLPGAVQLQAVSRARWFSVSPPFSVPYAGEYVFVVDGGLPTLSGIVVADDSGAPVAGAEVTSANPLDGRPVHVRVVTGADGRFSVPQPVVRGRLLVSAAGFAPAYVASFSLKDGVEVRLTKAARLEGRVTSAEDGKPVPGVTVLVHALAGRRNREAEPDRAVSDAEGRYAFPSLFLGEATLVVSGAAWVARGLSKVDAGFDPLALTLEPGKTTRRDVVVERAARVAGQVVDPAGAPVAGATVVVETQASFANTGGWIRSFGTVPSAGSTGADGRFALDGLLPGALHVVTASAAGFPPTRSEAFVASPSAPADVVVRLGVPRRFEVRVTDEEGAPVPAAEVRVAAGGFPSSWIADGQGIARVGPVATGAASVSATARGFGASASIQVGADETRVTVELERGGVISGRVLRPDGAPAAGFSVRVQRDATYTILATATADAEGTFRLEDVPPGTWVVEARGSQDGTLLSARASASVGTKDVVLQTTELLDLPTGDLLRIRVLDFQGKAVPRATGALVRDRGGGGFFVENGSAKVLALDGDGTFFVWGAATAGGTPLPLGCGSAPFTKGSQDEIEVRLPPAMSAEGTVTGPDGRGVAGVTLIAVVAAWESVVTTNYSQAVAVAHTDDTGAFRLRGLGPDEVRLVVKAPAEFVPVESMTVKGGASGLRIVLARAASPRITVTDDAGNPLATALVRVGRGTGSFFPISDEVARAYTDASGSVALWGLDPNGTYRLEVSAPASRTDLVGRTVEPWTPRDEAIRLRRPTVLRGVVRDPSGRPVEGAQVMRFAGGNGLGTTSRADGTFEFLDVPTGPITLQATMDSSENEKSPMVPTQAGATDVVLVVDPGLELVVRVADAPRDFAGTTATLDRETRDGTSPRQAAVSPDGVARFRGLRSGSTYSVWIPPTSKGLLCLRRGIAADARDLVVRLAPAKTLSGRIRWPATATFPYVSVSITPSVSVRGRVERDGHYEVTGLPEGPVRVFYTASFDGKSEGSQSAEANGGDVLDLEVLAPGKR